MEPILRKEMFMAKAAGQNVNVPEPITREEKYLAAIAKSGCGAGDMLVTITAVMAMDMDDEPQYVADKTFEEIESAVNAGKNVRVKFFLEGADTYTPLSAHFPGNEVYFMSYVNGLRIIIAPDSVYVEIN